MRALAHALRWTSAREGLWTRRAAHPEWRPAREEVVCFALEQDDGLALVDPLLPRDGGEELLAARERLAGGRPPLVFVTIPYHVRSAAVLAARRPGARVRGHEHARRRLPAGTPFTGRSQSGARCEASCRCSSPGMARSPWSTRSSARMTGCALPWRRSRSSGEGP